MDLTCPKCKKVIPSKSVYGNLCPYCGKSLSYTRKGENKTSLEITEEFIQHRDKLHFPLIEIIYHLTRKYAVYFITGSLIITIAVGYFFGLLAALITAFVIVAAETAINLLYTLMQGNFDNKDDNDPFNPLTFGNDSGDIL